MGEVVEERGRHLGIAEDGGPFAEAQVGGDDDAGAIEEGCRHLGIAEDGGPFDEAQVCGNDDAGAFVKMGW